MGLISEGRLAQSIVELRTFSDSVGTEIRLSFSGPLLAESNTT